MSSSITAKIYADGRRVECLHPEIPSPPTLSKWSVCDQKDAPYVAGVYAIIVESEGFGANSVAYIGESICLASRLRSHSVIKELISDGYVPIIRFFASEHHFDIEPKMIRKYRPVFNVAHNRS